MTHRISVRSTVHDASAERYLKTLKTVFPTSGLERVAVTKSYTFDVGLSKGEIKKIAESLTNRLTEEYSLEKVLSPQEFSYAIEIGYLPGVTDNVGTTARQTAEDCTRKKFKDGEAVYSSSFIFLTGAISEKEAQAIAGELHNPLIERASIYKQGDSFPVILPKVVLQHTHTLKYMSMSVKEIDLNVNDEELKKTSREGIANPDGSSRGPLALSLRAMKTIRDYFKKQGRNPTDVELEALAQTWSEHCKHTIFSDPLDEVKDGIYRTYIKGATQKIRKQKGKKDFCVSVFTDNAGAIAFDDEYLVTHKVETHNAPSALDPFGGSVTAIVGVNRDCLGFGLGAKPIANVYGFCVGNPNDARQLFRDKNKTQQLLPARRILEGVVAGINAGGNQSGIPTPLGFVNVDDSFRGKPLVFGGTVGLIPRRKNGKKLYEKRARPGDYIVMIGGRVGLDGIHGATFSSESLNTGSPATAVQIGDPITQKKLSDALVREVRDKGLYSSITDNGAGGLSGAVGEMAKEAGGPSPRRSGLRPREGGCVVDLNTVPLKYPGLAPWQMWISESQERMTLAVPPSKWKELSSILKKHDVEATRIGTFTNSGRCIVKYKKRVVMDIEMKFLHDGRPIEMQRSKKIALPSQKTSNARKVETGTAILRMLARPNIGSIGFVSAQYDHEVQGRSVTKPLQGKGRVNADAGVLQPLANSSRGIVLSHGICPQYSAIDTYAMAAAAIDTAVRNAVCAGANSNMLAILDNFCWSSSEKPERLYELKRAAQACYDIATAYGTPFISGKDSMFNDFRGFTKDGKPIHIAALPTLLVSTLGVIPDVEKAMTIDFKSEGDAIYLLGETRDELGASEYYSMLGIGGGKVPVVSASKNAAVYDAVSKAIQKELVASAIGLGRGGLAVALAKSAVAGGIGVQINLEKQKAEQTLFSESQGRILVSVAPSARSVFERLCKKIPYAYIGNVQGNQFSIVTKDSHINFPLAQLSESYRSFFKNW